MCMTLFTVLAVIRIENFGKRPIRGGHSWLEFHSVSDAVKERGDSRLVELQS